jgi:hypothetical protein
MIGSTSKLRFFNIIDGVAANYPIIPASPKRDWLSTAVNELSSFVWKPRNLKNFKISKISKTTKLRFL